VPVISGGGGGVQPFRNSCSIDVAAPTLNLATSRYVLTPSDLSIRSQSGSDFSIGAWPGHPTVGAVISAAGGYFQASFFLGPPGGVTLDAGSDAPRYLEFALITGDFGSPTLHSFGIDAYVPVSEASLGNIAVTPVATPGFAVPGGTAIFDIAIDFISVFGTDEITGPFDGSAFIDIWQVA
jgi:hypothetical protein